MFALGVAGCTTEPAVTSTEEFLKRNNGFIPNGVQAPNEHGHSTTYARTGGGIDLNNEFFQDLGANGRRCISCHLPNTGWGITPEAMQDTFERTEGGVKADGFGLGAAFRTNDGANRPNYTAAELDTVEERRAAYSMLLNRGLIRVGIGIPTNAEFTLTAVDDPYGYASSKELSLFRRPLPSTNLGFLATVMWDGRETFAGQTIHFDLVDQANGATQGHAEAPDPITDAQREAIVAFETNIVTAQESDNGVGALNQGGAAGGAQRVFADMDAFYIGKNDNTGDYRYPVAFTSNVFTLYNAWSTSSKSGRKAIARGQEIFNNAPMILEGVAGLNGGTLPANPQGGGPVTLPASFTGTCTTCHNNPNAGNHTISVPLNIGLVTESMRTPDMPLYELTCTDGSVHRVTDPGRALITGRCADIGKFKGPILRALASRAPYFHNGVAESLDDVVEFYNTRFRMNLTAQQKSDLAAFLATL
jgi:cytochrome c peroxidase